MRCGLLGRKLGHSYSPQIHGHLGEYTYELFEVEPNGLGSFLRCGEFTGLNVTIPYKKDVIPFCHELTPTAKRLGAVNTIIRRNDGSLLGHNTDYYGFTHTVRVSGLNPCEKKVLVLGSGGASNTVCAVMAEMGAKVVVISRSGENNYSNLHIHSDCAILVNATPVGMYPNNEYTPLSLDVFPKLEGVIDLIYNPSRTQLLLDAQARGVIAQNGLPMLVAQAWESAQYFTGKKIPQSTVPAIIRTLRKQTENIVLIGMPGCGKTTLGKALAEATGRRFVDADAVLSQQAGCSIPQIFTAEGEQGFRSRETEILKQLGRGSGQVIATGGGCVTRRENYAPLRQNAILIWIRRDLDRLSIEGRPLSQAGSLNHMYEARRPAYEAFSDLSVENNGSVESAVAEICKALEAL